MKQWSAYTLRFARLVDQGHWLVVIAALKNSDVDFESALANFNAPNFLTEKPHENGLL